MDKDKITKVVAKNLKQIRLTKHLTQVEVAKGADIASNHYARIERGEAIPSIVTLVSLAKSLKVKSSDILPL